jgi:hypothetical protein
MVESVVKFREEYEIDRHIGELIEFVRRLTS